MLITYDLEACFEGSPIFGWRVGIGYSIHAGMVIVADGTAEAAEKLRRVLTTDPGTGIMRHADAGHVKAIRVARERGVDIPMLGTTPQISR